MTTKPMTRACRDARTPEDHRACPNAIECGCDCHETGRQPGIMPACLLREHRACEGPKTCKCPCHALKFEAPPSVPKAGGPVALYGESIEVLRAFPGEWVCLTTEPLKVPTAANRAVVLKRNFAGLEATVRRIPPEKNSANLYVRWPKDER